MTCGRPELRCGVLAGLYDHRLIRSYIVPVLGSVVWPILESPNFRHQQRNLGCLDRGDAYPEERVKIRL